MRKSIIKRLRKIEQHTFQPRRRLVVKDYDGLYGGECGKGLTQEQFDAWVKAQDSGTQVIIVEVCAPDEPEASEQEVTSKVENHVDKSVSDFLKGVDDLIQISRSDGVDLKANQFPAQEVTKNT